MAITVDQIVTELIFKGDTRALGRIERRVEAIRNKLNSLSSIAFRVGAVMTAAAVAPVKAYANFEASLAKINALTIVSKEQVDAWIPSIHKIAAATGKGPDVLAGSLYEIASAGYKGEEALDILRYSAKASTAGLGETNVIADLLTSAIKAYGSANLSAAEAADILTAAVEQGKLPADALAGTMGRLFPLASKLKIPFSEVAAMMAAMSLTGTGPEEGATQIRGILNQLIQGSPKTVKALEKMGLTIEGVRANIADPNIGLIKTLQMLNEKTGGDIGLTGELFSNIRGLTGFLDLMNEEGDIAVATFDRVRNAGGSLEESFAAVGGTLNFLASQAMAGFQSILISIGEEMRENVVLLLDWIKKISTWFQELGDSGKQTVATFLTFGPILLGLGLALRLLSFLLGGFKVVLVAITAAQWLWNTAMAFGRKVTLGTRIQLAALAAWGAILAAKTAIWTAAQWLWNVAMTANPIGAIIVAIGLLIAAAVALWVYWDDVWGWIMDAAKFAGDYISNLFSGIFGWLSDKFKWALGKIGIDFGSSESQDVKPNLNALTTATQPGTNSTTNQSKSISIGDTKVTVNAAPGMNEVELAQNVGKAVRDQHQSLVEYSDSRVQL